MKTVLVFTLAFFSLTLTAQWRLVYENDAEGQLVQGAKEELITAVKSGAEVRVGWVETHPRNEDESFEHFATATSIIIAPNGELYVELPGVSSLDVGRRNSVIFRDDGRRIPIVSTRGQVEFTALGAVDMIRRASLSTGAKWFIRK